MLISIFTICDESKNVHQNCIKLSNPFPNKTNPDKTKEASTVSSLKNLNVSLDEPHPPCVSIYTIFTIPGLNTYLMLRLTQDKIMFGSSLFRDYFSIFCWCHQDRGDLTKNVRLSGLDGEGKLIGILEIYIETLLYLQRRDEGERLSVMWTQYKVSANSKNKQI